MSQVIEFPRNRPLKQSEIENVTKLVEQAVEAHGALKQYADWIKTDPRLASVRPDVLLKTLTIMLDEK